MSNFIPPNIIQTPDFAGLAKERIDRKREEEASKNAFLDQFEQAQGLYLDGDRPAVQSAWDKVQSTIDMVAENDTPESRRQLKQVYADYAKVAGTAQVLADQHRTEVAAYKADPTKYAMSGGDFFSWDEDFRTKTRSFDDMQSALDNPNVLPSSASYALLNPFEQAQTLMGETANITSTFYDASGALDAKGLRSRIKDIATKKIMANPEAMERAIIWGATTANNGESGFAGDGDGKINSLEELNMIKELPQDQRDAYMNAYLESLVDNYIDLTPGLSQGESGKTKLSGYSMTMQVEGEFSGIGAAPLEEVNVDMISLPGTVKRGGLGFSEVGVDANGNYYVTVETKEEETYEDPVTFESKTRTVTKSETRKANPNEVSAILSVYGDKYDFSTLAPPPPVEQAATEEATEEAPEEAPEGEKEPTIENDVEGTLEPEETTETTAVTIDPADDALGIFTDQTTAEVETSGYSNIENQADETLERISRGVSAKELEEDKPYMFKEAEKLQKDIVDTKAQIKEANKAGKDTTALEEKLEQQKGVLKKVNKVNRTISERRGRREFEQNLPELKMDEDPLNEDVKEPTDKPVTTETEPTTEETPVEAAAEEAPTKETKEQPAEETKNRDYIVMQNGVVVFRDEYDSKFAGKPSSTGTPFPDTFEEYAEAFQQTIKNEAEDPVDIVAGVDRTTGVKTDKSEEPIESDSVVLPMVTSAVLSEMGTSTEGDGKRDGKGGYNYKIYKERDVAIGRAENAEEGVPSPVSNPSSTEGDVYYAKGLDEDFKWTPETVQKAFDRWNANVPVEPEVWIKVANQFGIPVEIMIAMAAAEGNVGRGERQKITKNFFNWGNSTKGDNLPTGSEEQDKYNTYFKTWEDGLKTWADGLVRMYRPDDGNWSKLWEGDDTFVTQRKTKTKEGKIVAKGSRYASGKDYEKMVRDTLKFSFEKQFGDDYRKKE